MAFYVSVLRNPRRPHPAVLALGPFNTHGAALAHVDEVRQLVQRLDSRGHWYGYGTCRHPLSRQPGRLNQELDYAGPGGLP